MKSLAEFILNKRENAGLSIVGLARKATLEVQLLEDIELGKNFFYRLRLDKNLLELLNARRMILKISKKILSSI